MTNYRSYYFKLYGNINLFWIAADRTIDYGSFVIISYPDNHYPRLQNKMHGYLQIILLHNTFYEVIIKIQYFTVNTNKRIAL